MLLDSVATVAADIGNGSSLLSPPLLVIALLAFIEDEKDARVIFIFVAVMFLLLSSVSVSFSSFFSSSAVRPVDLNVPVVDGAKSSSEWREE